MIAHILQKQTLIGGDINSLNLFVLICCCFDGFVNGCVSIVFQITEAS